VVEGRRAGFSAWGLWSAICFWDALRALDSVGSGGRE